MKFKGLLMAAAGVLSTLASIQPANAFLGFHKKPKTEARADNFYKQSGDTVLTRDIYNRNAGAHVGTSTVVTYTLADKVVKQTLTQTNKTSDGVQKLTLLSNGDNYKGFMTARGDDNAKDDSLNNNYAFTLAGTSARDAVSAAAKSGTLSELRANAGATIAGRNIVAPPAAPTVQ